MQPLHDHHQPSRTLAPRPSSSSLRLLSSLNSALNKLPKLRKKRGRTSTGSEEEKRTGSRQRRGTGEDKEKEPLTTCDDDASVRTGINHTVDSSTAASAAFQEHCASSPPTEDKDDPTTKVVEGVLHEGKEIVNVLKTNSPSIKETEPNVSPDEPVSSTSSPTAFATASLADMIRDMYAGNRPLDLELLTRYTSHILSRWSTDTYKWDRLALWNVLTTLFKRVEEESGAEQRAEEALLAIGEMKARLLREEWLRINLDRTRRDNDYDDRVSSLILAFAVLIGKLRYFHEGVGAQVYPVLNGVLDELRARSSASPLDFHVLTLLAVLDTKSADLLVRLSDLNMRVILRIVVRRIESGDSEPLDAASRIACSIIDRLILSNPHRHRWFVDEFCGPLMHASVTALRRPWQSRQLPLVKILFHRLVRLGKEPFAQPVVLETLVDLLSASRTSYSIHARLHARARLMIDEADEPVALDGHIQKLIAPHFSKPSPTLRRLLRRRRRVTTSNRLPSPALAGPSFHSSDSLSVFPYLSFSPTLASFPSGEELLPPLPSPVAVDVPRFDDTDQFSHLLGGYDVRVVRCQERDDRTREVVRETVVKIGEGGSVSLEELEVACFLGTTTGLPVPQVLAVRATAGRIYSYLDFLPGQRLDESLPSMTDGAKANVLVEVQQIADVLERIPLPPGTPVGGFSEPWTLNVTSFALPPTIFPVARPASSADFLNLVSSILCHPPHLAHLSHLDTATAPRLPPHFSHSAASLPLVFTHGDLVGRNVLVDPQSGKLTALLDFHRAGFWPQGMEETMALLDGMVDGIPEEDGQLIAAAFDAHRRSRGEGSARADWLEALFSLR